MRRYNFGPYRGEKLKIAIMGGAEEIGRNITMMEYEDDIIIIDMGLQFPEEEMLGIDYIIPDMTYFKGKEDKIKGVIITHGHYDHIGAISHIIPNIGNPPMFMAKLTAGLVRKRHEDFRGLPPLNISEFDEKSRIRLGKNFNIEFFRVNHTIPDSFGIAVYTPAGLVLHSGDFKIDFSPIPPDLPANLAKYANLGNQGVLALLLDSTNVDLEGHQLSESDVKRDIEKIFLTAPGRIIVGTFASEIAHQLGYLKMHPGQVIESAEVNRLPAKNIVIIGTGAQGQDRAFLTRFANDEHRYLSIQQGDTIVFSSSVIPGNERTVHMDVHAGGHAKQEDCKLMLRLVRPRYFIPIEGTHYKLRMHAEVAKEVGIPDPRILIPENGQVMEFNRAGGRITNRMIPSEYVFVDGLGVDDVNHVVLRDRQMMAEDGMFVVIATISKKTGELIGSPDIISRGFVYMKESQKLIEQARAKVKKILTDKDPKSGADDTYIKAKIRNEIGEFLYSKTKRRPMVLPVVIEV